MESGLAKPVAKESTSVAEGAKSDLQEGLRQRVVYLLGTAVCCLGHALVGEEEP